ncbi:MAG: thiamine-monophosphate kinase [Phycisphaerae bacterium]
MNPVLPQRDTAAEPERGERALVRRIAARLAASAAPPGSGSSAATESAGVPFGDDMAAIEGTDSALLWTTDTLMDGIDFDSRQHAWRDIGRKAIAVSLSDCAAMAVRPVSALCNLVLCENMTADDALELVGGAVDFAARWGCAIVGGDTNSWRQPTVISFTVAARACADLAPVRRDGAQPGDRIFITGRVGGSILGRHMTFEPRVEQALAIARRVRVHAQIDVSDGVAIDLSRVCEASRCGAVLDERDVRLAIHADAERLAAQDGVAALEHALYDGEDFELLCVLPADVPDRALNELGLLAIGRIVAEPGLWMRHADGARRVVEARGWEHFR